MGVFLNNAFFHPDAFANHWLQFFVEVVAVEVDGDMFVPHFLVTDKRVLQHFGVS